MQCTPISVSGNKTGLEPLQQICKIVRVLVQNVGQVVTVTIGHMGKITILCDDAHNMTDHRIYSCTCSTTVHVQLY